MFIILKDGNVTSVQAVFISELMMNHMARTGDFNIVDLWFYLKVKMQLTHVYSALQGAGDALY